jgi:hypothetical protein
MLITVATIISYWIGFGVIIGTTLYLGLQFAKLCELAVDTWSRRTKNGMQSSVGCKPHMENE